MYRSIVENRASTFSRVQNRSKASGSEQGGYEVTFLPVLYLFKGIQIGGRNCHVRVCVVLAPTPLFIPILRTRSRESVRGIESYGKGTRGNGEVELSAPPALGMAFQSGSEAGAQISRAISSGE